MLTACVENNGTYKTLADAPVPRIVGDAWTKADLRIADAASATVLIYSHGTRRPQRFANCEAPGFTLPQILEQLDGGSVHVVRHCSRATEQSGPSTAGQQVFARAAELTRLAEGYVATGVTADRIFLAGNSNGGWSSLMAYAQKPTAFGGVVAFAPAFSGPRSEITRFPWWRQDVRPRHVAKLKVAPELKALIFAYENDAFNRPQELQFLPEAHPKTVTLVSYGCPGVRPHGTYRRDCRLRATTEAIKAFVGIDNAPVTSNLLKQKAEGPAPTRAIARHGVDFAAP
ncbi:MAG: alpha/beta hydrolase-fold protein [Pseudomonadota bacterium]